MSKTPSSPVHRESLYPEPHRVGDWQSPHASHRSYRLVIGLGLLAIAVVLWAIVQLGLEVGRSRGTSSPDIVNPDGTVVNAIQAEPGMCLAELPENGTVARVTAIPCSTPHRAEVVSSYRLAGHSWPGRDEVATRVLDHCGAFIQPGFDAGSMFETGDWQAGLRWVAWIPTEKSWDMDRRSGVCVVYREGDIVGSFLAGTAAFTD